MYSKQNYHYKRKLLFIFLQIYIDELKAAIRENKTIFFVVFQIISLNWNKHYLCNNKKMQKLNNVFFSLLKILKILLCIYNALYLSKLGSYRLYKSIKLKQTGWQNQKTTNKGRLGTLAWMHTMKKITVDL